MTNKDTKDFLGLADAIMKPTQPIKELITNDKLVELDDTFKLYDYNESEQLLVEGDTERFVEWLNKNLGEIQGAITELRNRRGL